MDVVSIILMIVCVVMALVVALFAGFWLMSWNIPVLVFRLVGDKGRPMAIFTKGKKIKRGGIHRLFVKGYNIPYRDFRAENYFPSPRGKHGALILWEFKPGYLTPTIPFSKDLTEEQQLLVKSCQKVIDSVSTVKFQFDENLYKHLLLKAVDDVDTDIMIEEISRVNSQYVGGLRDFFLRYGGHISLVIVCVIMLVIVVLGLEKAPEIAKACANSATEVAKTTLQKAASAAVAPGG